MAQRFDPEPARPPAPLSLTPQQRKALLLRYDAAGHASRTHGQVAQLLGCSTGRARNIEARARLRLRVLQRMVGMGQPLGREQMVDWLQFQTVIDP